MRRRSPRRSRTGRAGDRHDSAAFRGRARRDAAAFYLSQLAKGVLAGELGIETDHGQIALATGEFLVLKIEVKQKKRANHVEVTLRWPNRSIISREKRNGQT